MTKRRVELKPLYSLRLLKPHRNLIGTILRACFAHLICEGGPAFLARVISVAARRAGYCRDDHAVAVNVDHARSCPNPGEINGVKSMHLVATGSQRDSPGRRCWRGSRS